LDSGTWPSVNGRPNLSVPAIIDRVPAKAVLMRSLCVIVTSATYA